ncbi:MAG TPA: hypothetical protein VE078_15405 [Thermoanaerobaculia bacterium]|nr:hypothetical protein [Thermoanaerobaculia bacterium]
MKTAWRAALALTGAGLAAMSFSQLVSFRTEQRRIQAQAREAGALAFDPDILERLSREPDPWRAKLRLARTLFASAATASQIHPDSALRQLEVARELSSQVAAERPAAWEAFMTQGAATYLAWSMRRDRRLLNQPEEWEAPLLRALELAPGRPEPVRFLATAYLELWPVLSEGKRREARALVKESLSQRATFDALIEIWLRTAGSRREAFAAIPALPWAWDRLQQIEARDGNWTSYSEARRRWYALLQTQARRDLAEAEARLHGGDLGRARLLFLSLLQLPPRQRFVPVVESALAQCPPGAGTGSLAPAIRAWLDWSLDLCLWRGCPLPEPVLKRLAGLAGELEPPLAARAALAAGDLAASELYERRAKETWTLPWGPYQLARAQALTHRRELGEAARSLDTVHPSLKRSAPYWRARLSLARARGDSGGAAEAQRNYGRLRRSEWSARDWIPGERVPRLELLPVRSATGLSIEILGTPDLGAGIEVRLDGEVVLIAGAKRGDVLVVQHAFDAGAHVLEVEAVSGGLVTPGRVRLAGAYPAVP